MENINSTQDCQSLEVTLLTVAHMAQVESAYDLTNAGFEELCYNLSPGESGTRKMPESEWRPLLAQAKGILSRMKMLESAARNNGTLRPRDKWFKESTWHAQTR